MQKFKIIYRIIMYSIGFIGLVLFTYPLVIFHLYGRELPSKWENLDFCGSIGDIRKELGPADYEMAVRSEILWQEDYWWGEKKIYVSPNGMEYTDNDYPYQVIYMVTLRGYSFVPIYDKVISRYEKPALYFYPFINESDIAFAKPNDRVCKQAGTLKY